ncbi:hypothetical protein [Methylocystis echinoides]|uniref:hypothetical protein n=1 Tax=Methylocystis echinoides TaxID=29468 RepID=UPI00249052DF|nr:hypothetical protein [Methylocystis echinoides]
MPETAYGLVEVAFSFGLVIAFCVWQLRSIETARKRLREEHSRKEEQSHRNETD